MFNSTIRNSVLALATLSGLGFAAPPLEKNGPCPTLTRYTAPRQTTGDNSGADNWTLFPVKPPTALYPTGTVQNPLPPDSSINCIIVPEGLKVQLLASELTPTVTAGAPSMAYLMYFTFDEKGRVWAVEPRDYPYTHGTNGMPDSTVPTITAGGGLPNNRLAGRGRILILTDTDKDGSLDNFKVFHTGFVAPTSLELVKGGVIVTVPPNIYFVPFGTTNPDTAGGDAQVIVSNMSSTGQNYDTHGQTNSLTRGIDNFIYGGVGYNNCGTPQVQGGNSASGCSNGSVYRFKSTQIGHDTNLIQVFSPGGENTNSHGLGQTEDGQIFTSKATVTNHSYHAPYLGATMRNTLRTNYSAADSVHNFYPATRDYYAWEGSTSRFFRFNGVDTVWATNESAVSGHDFYTATLLPSEYRRRSFVCEGMTHLCNQNEMTIRGSTWRANRRYGGPRISNIFASSDAWTAPLKVRTGPDGALWVLDWYNYLFLHNPANPMTNSAWRGHLRHKERVRLYRIVPENGPTSQPVLDLSNASGDELVSTLGHTNLFWRTTAQRLIIDRFTTYNGATQQGIINRLHTILNTERRYDSAFGTSPQVLHALWTVNGLKAYTFDAEPTRWDTTFKKLLLHPAWTVRRNAVLAMPVTQASADAIVAQCAVNDVHPHVRLQALAALIARPAPTTPATMVSAYRNTDTATVNNTLNQGFTGSAFTSAGATKVTEIPGSERPSSCPAYQAGVSIRDVGARNVGARRDLRFDVRNGGFVLSNNLQLGSGELVVSDLRGKVVFRSTYNKASGQWSNPVATNLSLPVYFYSYREIAGGTFRGRIALAADL